jgi:hypothetical protein
MRSGVFTGMWIGLGFVLVMWGAEAGTKKDEGGFIVREREKIFMA